MPRTAPCQQIWPQPFKTLCLALIMVLSWAMTSQVPALAQTADWIEVQTDRLGLRMLAPPTWTTTRVDGHTLLLTGASTGPDGASTITLTNQRFPEGQSGAEGTAALVATYLSAVGARGGEYEILREAPFLWVEDGPAQDGLQVVVRLARRDGQVARQWLVAIPRTDLPVAHIWIFSTTEQRFDGGVSLARGMLESLRVQ
ncbi:MAG: hypothetical protein ACPGOY_06295 [Rhodospirillaceae bacterium]